MMELKKIHLTNAVLAAGENKAKYFGVIILNETGEYPQREIIINTLENMQDGKYNYYINAYDDNLCLKTNRQIRIGGFTYGNDGNSILEDLNY